MINILSIQTIEVDDRQYRHADIIISDGESAFLWGVGGLPAEGDLQAILEAREAELWTAAQAAGRVVLPEHQAKIDFRTLPGWASWTGQQAADYVHNAIHNGMTVQELDAWIDTNITGTTVPQILASVRAAFKQLVRADLAGRDISEKNATGTMFLRDFLRDVVIR